MVKVVVISAKLDFMTETFSGYEVLGTKHFFLQPSK